MISAAIYKLLAIEVSKRVRYVLMMCFTTLDISQLFCELLLTRSSIASFGLTVRLLSLTGSKVNQKDVENDQPG